MTKLPMISLVVLVSVMGRSVQPEYYAADNFVIVIYNGEKYPGKILKITDDGPEVECIERGLKFWRWPAKPDCITYDWKDVWGKINPPKLASKRNQFSVPELEYFV